MDCAPSGALHILAAALLLMWNKISRCSSVIQEYNHFIEIKNGVKLQYQTQPVNKCGAVSGRERKKEFFLIFYDPFKQIEGQWINVYFGQAGVCNDMWHFSHAPGLHIAIFCHSVYSWNHFIALYCETTDTTWKLRVAICIVVFTAPTSADVHCLLLPGRLLL